MEANPRLKGVVNLYREIFSVQRKMSQRIPDRLPHIEGAQVSARLVDGRLLLEPGELEVDLGILEEMLRETAGVLKKRSERPPAGLDEFLERDLDEAGLKELVEAYQEGDEERFRSLVEGQALDPAVAFLLLHVSLAPFYWKAVGSLARQADLDQVPRGTCPVCGDLPIMGFHRGEDGLRVLECSRCGTRWGVPRMMCPFCLTTDQKKLHYIFPEKDRSRRAYLCDGCGRYIKIRISPPGKEEEFVVPLEDMATAHLDVAAEEKGYRRGCRTVFS